MNGSYPHKIAKNLKNIIYELIPKPISFPIYYTIFMLEIRAIIQNSRFWDRLYI